MWWMVVAHAVEPCTPSVTAGSAAPTAGGVAHLAMPEDVTVRRFVTDPDLAPQRPVAFPRARRDLVEHVPVTLLPDGHRIETVLALAGAQRLPGGSWRIGGAEPRLVIDGVAMDSNLR